MTMNKARQSARDVKKRKAKARQKQAAEHRSWIDRPKVKAQARPSLLFGAGASLSLAEALNRNPDLMDRLFGEPYHRSKP